MAENIYSKGTRVWFDDKDHAWISAEVLSVTKAADDTIKLVFVDERGKVFYLFLGPRLLLTLFVRKLPSIPPERRSKMGRKACHLCEILLCWRLQMIWQHSHI